MTLPRFIVHALVVIWRLSLRTKDVGAAAQFSLATGNCRWNRRLITRVAPIPLLRLLTKGELGIFLAQLHDARIEIFGIDPGGYAVRVLCQPRDALTQNAVFERWVGRIDGALGSDFLRNQRPLPSQVIG